MANLVVRINFPLRLESASFAEFTIDSNGAVFTSIAKVRTNTKISSAPCLRSSKTCELHRLPTLPTPGECRASSRILVKLRAGRDHRVPPFAAAQRSARTCALVTYFFRISQDSPRGVTEIATAGGDSHLSQALS